MKYTKRYVLATSLFAVATFYPMWGQAATSTTSSSSPQATTSTLGDDFFPLIPRFTAFGYTGTDTIAGGDFMAPLYGNSNGVLFLDLQGKTAFSQDWVGSLGLGLRQALNNSSILGAYVFADRNISPESQEFWFVSPGAEWIGQQMDVHVNGYIPVSNNQLVNATGFADTLGNYDYINFTGHDQYDAIINQFEEVGWGIDAEIGSKIPGVPGLHAYVGGYHFNFDDVSDTNGVIGKLEYALNAHLAVTVSDSYDNQEHNTLVAGVKLTLGGVNQSPRSWHQPIQERLLDPIERNLATLGQGTAEPVVSGDQVIQNGVLEKTNIWFFSPNASGTYTGVNSCTAEHPCSDDEFDQATIDGINTVSPTVSTTDNPSFYLAPGQYSSLTVVPGPDDEATGVPLVLTNDSVYGRSADFKQPEQSATLVGAMDLVGVDTLDHLIFSNSAAYPQLYALNLTDGSDVLLNTVQIGANKASSAAYTTAIQMVDATLTVDGGSNIMAYSNTGAAIGINALSGAFDVININNSVVSAVDKVTVGTATAIGINANATNNLINVFNSAINVDADVTLGNTSSSALAQGIAANGVNNAIYVGYSSLDVTADVNNGKGATAQGIFVKDEGSANTKITLDHSAVDVLANVDNLFAATGSSPSVLAQGIAIDTFGVTGVTNNVINLWNFSTLDVDAEVLKGNATMGNPINLVRADGIVVGFGTTPANNVTNTINIDHSEVNVAASIINAALLSPSSVVVNGISLTGGTNSANYVNISNHSYVNVDGDIVNGGNINNQVNAFGINISVGQNSIDQVVIGSPGKYSDNSGVWVNSSIEDSKQSVVNVSNATGITMGGSSPAATNVMNTLTLQGASTVWADAEATTAGFNNTTATGITMLRGTNIVTLNDYARVIAQALSASEDGLVNATATATGMSLLGQNNMVTLNDHAGITATASAGVDDNAGVTNSRATSQGISINTGTSTQVTLNDQAYVASTATANGKMAIAQADGIFGSSAKNSVITLNDSSSIDAQANGSGPNSRATANGIRTSAAQTNTITLNDQSSITSTAYLVGVSGTTQVATATGIKATSPGTVVINLNDSSTITSTATITGASGTPGQAAVAYGIDTVGSTGSVQISPDAADHITVNATAPAGGTTTAVKIIPVPPLSMEQDMQMYLAELTD